MICPNCGKENVANAKFCPACGTALESPVPVVEYEPPVADMVNAAEAYAYTPAPEPAANDVNMYGTYAYTPAADPVASDVNMAGAYAYAPAADPAARKKKPILMIAIIGACAAAFVVLLLTGVISFGGFGGGSSSVKNLATIYDYDSKMSYLVYDGKVLEKKLDGSIWYTLSNEDGSIWLFGLEQSDGVIDLYCLKNGAVERIDSDVHGYNLSPTGNFALYYKTDDAVYLYDLSKGSKTKPKGGSGVDGVSLMMFSPDGKTCVFSVYEGKNPETEMYVHKNGESAKIGENMDPVALSNDGGLYYYDNEREAIYYTKTGSDQKAKIVATSRYFSVVSNYEKTQLIIVAYEDMGDDGKAYFTEKGSDKVRISGIDSDLYCVYPNVQFYPPATNYKIGDLRKEVFRQYGYVGSEDGVYTLNKDLSADRVAREVESVWLSTDKKIMYYSKSESLYCMRLDNDKGAERIAKNITYFLISDDGKTVYFINEDDELRYVKGTADSVKIADDVERFQIALDGTIFFITDVSSKTGVGSLYSCRNEKDSKLVADDVYDFSMYGDSQTYSVRLGPDEYDIYVGKPGKELKQMIKEIDITYADERKESNFTVSDSIADSL